MTSSVSILRLKRFVKEKLPEGSVVRQVIEADMDTLSDSEFVSRLGLWLRLLERKDLENE